MAASIDAVVKRFLLYARCTVIEDQSLQDLNSDAEEAKQILVSDLMLRDHLRYFKVPEQEVDLLQELAISWLAKTARHVPFSDVNHSRILVACLMLAAKGIGVQVSASSVDVAKHIQKPERELSKARSWVNRRLELGFELGCDEEGTRTVSTTKDS